MELAAPRLEPYATALAKKPSLLRIHHRWKGSIDRNAIGSRDDGVALLATYWDDFNLFLHRMSSNSAVQRLAFDEHGPVGNGWTIQDGKQ